MTRKKCFVSLTGVGPGIGLLRQVGKGHGPESVYSAGKRFRAAQSGRREQRWLKANRCKADSSRPCGNGGSGGWSDGVVNRVATSCLWCRPV